MIKNRNISNETLITQIQGNIVSDMDGEKVMLSINKGKYYNLGEIGGHIWELINEPLSIEQLVERLVEEYDVQKAECENQVKDFIKMLHKEELIEIKD